MSTPSSCRQWFTVTPDEKKELKRLGKELGISAGNYVYKRAFSKLRTSADSMAIRQLNKAGHNLNQLMKKVHAESAESVEIRAVISEIRAAVYDINKASDLKNDQH